MSSHSVALSQQPVPHDPVAASSAITKSEHMRPTKAARTQLQLQLQQQHRQQSQPQQLVKQRRRQPPKLVILSKQRAPTEPKNIAELALAYNAGPYVTQLATWTARWSQNMVDYLCGFVQRNAVSVEKVMSAVGRVKRSLHTVEQLESVLKPLAMGYRVGGNSKAS
ncbi:hypothetical protein K402DRAFT_420825 [Aulographum hederae CBS 113979]|uniref:Uncharacterized protein n=1 Tax=Aulographum hederae CBS 113979 TaxID=1176131 RepID=A0A6G1H1A6_9PEZI|nr:hypothetical protein K402DRAFT_420825 [Aulographum hederae CBS 113979]